MTAVNQLTAEEFRDELNHVAKILDKGGINQLAARGRAAALNRRAVRELKQ